MPERPSLILHVDDNDTNRYVVGRILTGAGFEVKQAATGEDGLRLAREEPDLILLDVNLPDLDGRDVCRRIKNDPETSHLVVVQISASFVDAEARVQGLEGGADGYLTYPLEPAELVANIRALLRLRHAEEEARLVARQWEATFDAISDGIVLTDSEGSVVRCSRKMTELLGRSFKEIIGQPLGEVITPVLGELTLLERTRQPEVLSRESAEARVGEAWYSVTADPVLTRGRKTGSVFIFSDVTRHREVEDALRAGNERLRVLSEAAAALLLNDEPERFIKQIYERLSRHLNLEIYFNYLVEPDGSALRLASHSGIHGGVADNVERLEFASRRQHDGEPLIEEYVQESTSPSTEWIRSLGLTAYACHPLLAGEQLLGTICFGSRSRSSFTRDELALIQIVSDQVAVALERARLFQELQQRADALARADRAKDEFLAMLSHELRNPLGAISNALQVMDLLGNPDGAQAEHRATVRRQLHHLGRMVDDLLDVSRITQGKIELRREPVELNAILRQALDAATADVSDRAHRLAVRIPDEPLWVDADATRIEQALLNLLKNACKYTEKGGQIRVSLAREESVAGLPTAVVRIRDTGVGIDPRMLPRVFDLFAQADQSLDRSQGGLGIGLTLVRTLVQLHGGSVSASSDGAGQGSEFTVRLPLIPVPGVRPSPARPPLEVASPTETPAARALRVLVVEDLQDARETLRDLLELWGHRVSLASDGAVAVDCMLNDPPDVALVDIGLPGLDGYEVARRVRTAPHGRRIHLVALTGYGLPEDRDRALAAGFDTHLTKPASGEKLNQLLSSIPVRHPD